MYTETTESYQDMFELHEDMNRILKAFRDAGKILDVEVNIDLLNLEITIITPKDHDDN